MSTGKRRGRGRGGGGFGGRGDSSADRSLRQKRDRQYRDGAESDSDEDVGRQTFSVQEKLASPKFPKYFVREMRGDDVTLAHFQRSGFNTPLHIPSKEGLGITAPDASFTVTDVKNAVGARRTIDVMDCNTQKNGEMSMKEWEEYYNNPNRDSRKLNVISLEFSFTKLEPYVVAPKVVRQIDWTDNVWPRHLKERQTEGTNDLREMKYPKVQKYCLMSVAGCYTDFHIDFGGTSVWYHLVKGRKVFWLIPPTEANLKVYEQWTLSGKQSNVFFGDLVEKCGKIELSAGHTFFIPSGWIHAVYTPEDSLVFGGNFLHSFAIEKQIRVAQIEEATKVPAKFRFPFFTELQWFTLDKYAYHLLGRTHLDLDEETKSHLLGSKKERLAFREALGKTHLTPQEIFGLKAIVMYIHALPVSKKNVPPLLPQPVNLVRDVRVLVDEHKDDSEELAVTGRPLLFWPGIKEDSGFVRKGGRPKKEDPTAVKRKSGKPAAERIPCKICQACISPDCGMCEFCADMLRFGGSGKLRRPCRLRQCLQPLLPIQSVCSICGLDGWHAETNMSLVDRQPGKNTLMECCICYEITHPVCMTDFGVDGYIKAEIPNTWECPKCVKAGLADKMKKEESSTASKVPKTEPEEGKEVLVYGADASYAGHQLFSVRGKADQPKHQLRAQLADQIISASTKTHKQPQYIFRPPPSTLSAEDIYERRQAGDPVDLKRERGIMIQVFRLLDTTDLNNVAVTCKAWNRLAQDPKLWNTVRLTDRKVTSHFLSLIVQRQPLKLLLDFCTLGRQQLSWLVPRLPQTRVLSLAGLDYPTSVVALSTVNCPMLHELDLSYVTSFNDVSLYKLLSSPKDSRPGLLDKKSRLKHLRKLCISGTEISDVGLRYVAQFLAQLQTLKIASCWKVSDAGLAQLAGGANQEPSKLQNEPALTHIDLSGCKGVTNAGLQHLQHCTKLLSVICVNSGVTHEGLKKFAEESSQDGKRRLKAQNGAVIEKKKY